jgi:hypothetical protein
VNWYLAIHTVIMGKPEVPEKKGEHNTTTGQGEATIYTDKVMQISYWDSMAACSRIIKHSN